MTDEEKPTYPVERLMHVVRTSSNENSKMSQYFIELKEYMRFSKADEEALIAFWPLATPHFKTIVEDFYGRLTAHANAMEVFRSEDQVIRLQATLTNWLSRLLSGPWGNDYFELRSKIGQVHVEIGMPQHFMFSAMAVIQEHLTQIAGESCDPKDVLCTTVAIQKITNIDLAIMLESYRDVIVGRIVSYENTELNLLTSRLEKTQALYHSIFESSAMAIMIADGDQKIQLFNTMAEKMTGYSRKDVIGCDLADTLAHPLDRKEMKKMLTAAAQLGGAPQELRAVTADKSDKWIRWHMSPIEETDDVCILGIDVTRERRLARQTRRVETLAALGTLAAGLAHEIRNPLNAAQLQLMLVERALTKAGEGVDSRALNSAGLVKAELSRLAGLVKDFLAFARPTDLRIGNAELCDLCGSVAEFLRGDAESAGVVLRSNMSENVFARVDAEKLKQVLINLLRNAIEAAEPGGDVELSCSRIAQNVFIEVSDSGAGIPDDIDIFEPFATSKEGGTGLGLPIVHRIITDHDGVLTVERRNDRTVFSVELPVDGPH